MELIGHVGSLVKIHDEFPASDISTHIEFYSAWKLNGKKDWHSSYGFPSAGISLLHSQFGNQDILGQSIAIIPSLRFEKWKKNTRWSWRAGLGIAGFNKPYSAIDNPSNLVIGSKFTNMTMLRIEMSKPLSSNLRYSIGLSYTHCSDSHIAVPNIGANIISLSAGISFCNNLSGVRFFSDKKHKEISHNTWMPGVQFIFGVHEFQGTTRPAGGPKYYVYGESIFISKKVKPGRKFSAGVNHHYYTAYHDYMQSQELFSPGTNIRQKANTLVLFSGYEWTFGRVAFFIQAGVNVYNPFIRAMNNVWNLPKHGSLYEYTSNKIGYKYYFRQQQILKVHAFNPYFMLAVKTNGGTADFLEFSVGAEIHSIGKKN